MAATIAQTIAIVDRSGKVVSSHKQLKNVFVEAKLAYQERKAEIKAERKQKEERELQKALKAMSVADIAERSDVYRPQTHRRPEHTQRRRRRSSEDWASARPHRDHQHSSGSPRPRHGSETESPRSPNSPPNLAQFNQDLYGTAGEPRTMPRSGFESPSDDPAAAQLIRRSNTDTMALHTQQRPGQTRSYSATDDDLDLAYGEFHAQDLAQSTVGAVAPEKELSSLVKKCQGLLDEAQCAGSSVKAIITHLQTNPDAMAAVALTLAEISNVAGKMAPGALTVFKSSAPAVMALLAAPEFLIAVGVGVGITVVMFGGYKIIKKIKEKRLNDSNENLIKGINANEANADEMIDVKQLSRIDRWRRGISTADGDADDETRSVVSGYSAATSVEGEFITPFAQRSMGHLPLPTKTSSKSAKVPADDGSAEAKDKTKRKKRKEKKTADSSSEAESVSSRGSNRDKQIIKVKKPSPLRRMFTAPSSTRS